MPGRTAGLETSASPLRQIFQRPVHLFKSPPRVGIQSPRQDRDEQAGEALALGEPDMIRSQRLDREVVLPDRRRGFSRIVDGSRAPTRPGFRPQARLLEKTRLELC